MELVRNGEVGRWGCGDVGMREGMGWGVMV